MFFTVFSSRNQPSHPVTIHTLLSPCNKALLEEMCMDCVWPHSRLPQCIQMKIFLFNFLLFYMHLCTCTFWL